MNHRNKYTTRKPRKTREKHGMTNARIYRIYDSMKNRCYSQNDSSYKNYGAKGITVCDLWKSSFMDFYNWSMANGYNDDLSIDRIDGTKGYSPENCRWVTWKEQSRNLKSNVMITYNGKTQCATAWAEELGFKKDQVYRAKKRGLSDAEVIKYCILLNGGAV